jgi:predicted metal-binding membrane protein
MPMPGGWTMSMVWMGAPPQQWTEAAASFIGMWVLMMVAMMLPSLSPMLWHYRQALGSAGQTRKAWLTVLVAVGYFFVWTLFGMAVYPVGIVLAAVEMRQPLLASTAPVAAGVVVLIAGAIQFSSFKAHHLDCCRKPSGRNGAVPYDAGGAWRHGVHLGLHCGLCCGGLMAILLVTGIMDVGPMAVVAAAITIERLAPHGERAARATGIVAAGVGLLMIARATGL